MVLQSKPIFDHGREVDDVTMRQGLMMMMSKFPNIIKFPNNEQMMARQHKMMITRV